MGHIIESLCVVYLNPLNMKFCSEKSNDSGPRLDLDPRYVITANVIFFHPISSPKDVLPCDGGRVGPPANGGSSADSNEKASKREHWGTLLCPCCGWQIGFIS